MRSKFLSDFYRQYHTVLWVGVLSFASVFLVTFYVSGIMEKHRIVLEPWQHPRVVFGLGSLIAFMLTLLVFALIKSRNQNRTLAEQLKNSLETNQHALARISAWMADQSYEDPAFEEFRRELKTYTDLDALEFQVTQVELDEVLQKAIQKYRHAIHQNQALIRSDTLPCVRGNERELLWLFCLLMENALIYRREEAPEIVITVEKEFEQWKICFADNGWGLSEEECPLVFSLFRSHQDFNPSLVGMALCKKIVERHGGKISLQSTLGRGSKFSLISRVNFFFGSFLSHRFILSFSFLVFQSKKKRKNIFRRVSIFVHLHTDHPSGAHSFCVVRAYMQTPEGLNQSYVWVVDVPPTSFSLLGHDAVLTLQNVDFPGFILRMRQTHQITRFWLACPWYRWHLQKKTLFWKEDTLKNRLFQIFSQPMAFFLDYRGTEIVLEEEYQNEETDVEFVLRMLKDHGLTAFFSRKHKTMIFSDGFLSADPKPIENFGYVAKVRNCLDSTEIHTVSEKIHDFPESSLMEKGQFCTAEASHIFVESSHPRHPFSGRHKILQRIRWRTGASFHKKLLHRTHQASMLRASVVSGSCVALVLRKANASEGFTRAARAGCAPQTEVLWQAGAEVLLAFSQSALKTTHRSRVSRRR